MSSASITVTAPGVSRSDCGSRDALNTIGSGAKKVSSAHAKSAMRLLTIGNRNTAAEREVIGIRSGVERGTREYKRAHTRPSRYREDVVTSTSTRFRLRFMTNGT